MSVVGKNSTQNLVRLLNRLLQLHSRTLPIYATSARPWTAPGQEQAATLLNVIAEDQQDRANRIAEYVLDVGGYVQQGEFSIDYTDMHDLSIDYLMRATVQELKRQTAKMEALVGQLVGDARGRALAEEALGAAKGHLQSVQEYLDAGRKPVAGRLGATTS